MKKLVNNFIYQIIYQITIIILPIITIPIVSKSLGAEGLGIYNYVTSIVTYFVLFAGLGLANYGIREISIVRGSKRRLSKKFWELELFNIIVALVILFIYLIFLILLKDKQYFFISGITLVATLFDISWFYYGVEDFKSISLINFAIKIISFSLILLLINSVDDLWIYFLIQSFSILISNISLWFFLRKKIYWIKPNIKKSLKHFKPASKYFIGKISVTLYTNLNKTLLGLMVSSIAVGIYSNSLQLITIFVTLIGTLDTVLMPHMTKLFSNNDHNKMITTMEKTLDFQFFISIPLMFGILSVNKQMIPWFFGSDFTLLNKTVPIFSPLVIIMPLGISIVRQYLIPRNRIREYNISVIISAIISIILNLSLLPILGIYGAVIATFVAECVVTIVRLIDLKKNTEFKLKVKNIILYFLCSIIMYFFIFFLTKNMPPKIYTTIIQGIIGIIVYFVSTCLFKVNIFVFLFKRENNKEKVS